jgi:hypothetical protein
MTRLIVFLITAVAAAAQARIDGRVLTPEGKPIPKATVVASAGSTSYVEETAQDGSYRFTLPPGKYRVGAEKHGFRTLVGYFSPKEVTAGDEPVRGFDLELRPLGVVSGVVLDADGDPVPNMTVSLLSSYTSNGVTQINRAIGGTTDDLGRFRVTLVNPGAYFLRAGYEPVRFLGDRAGPNLNEVRGASAQTHDIPVYYPDAADIKNAKPIEVSYTPIEGLVLRMSRAKTFRIQARGEGAPSGESSTVLILSPDGENRNLESEESRLPPGRYVLVARAGNYRDPSWFGMKEVTVVDRNLTDVVVPMQRTVTLAGKVTGASGKPASVPLRLTLLDIASSLLDPGFVQVSADGTFTTPNLARLKYRIGLLNAGTIRSIRLNGKDIEGGVLDLTDGQAGTLEIELGSTVR